jgi:hypothetical protein
MHSSESQNLKAKQNTEKTYHSIAKTGHNFCV